MERALGRLRALPAEVRQQEHVARRQAQTVARERAGQAQARAVEPPQVPGRPEAPVEEARAAWAVPDDVGVGVEPDAAAHTALARALGVPPEGREVRAVDGWG